MHHPKTLSPSATQLGSSGPLSCAKAGNAEGSTSNYYLEHYLCAQLYSRTSVQFCSANTLKHLRRTNWQRCREWLLYGRAPCWCVDASEWVSECLQMFFSLIFHLLILPLFPLQFTFYLVRDMASIRTEWQFPALQRRTAHIRNRWRNDSTRNIANLLWHKTFLKRFLLLLLLLCRVVERTDAYGRWWFVWFVWANKSHYMARWLEPYVYAAPVLLPSCSSASW